MFGRTLRRAITPGSRYVCPSCQTKQLFHQSQHRESLASPAEAPLHQESVSATKKPIKAQPAQSKLAPRAGEERKLDSPRIRKAAISNEPEGKAKLVRKDVADQPNSRSIKPVDSASSKSESPTPARPGRKAHSPASRATAPTSRELGATKKLLKPGIARVAGNPPPRTRKTNDKRSSEPGKPTPSRTTEQKSESSERYGSKTGRSAAQKAAPGHGRMPSVKRPTSKAKPSVPRIIKVPSSGPMRQASVRPFAEVKGHETLSHSLLKRSRVVGKMGNASDIEVIKASDLEIQPVETTTQPPVPALSYGLDRVLFNPGVYHLQDPRSKVYNFDPYLQKIMAVAEFDFGALKEYLTSSRDTSLGAIAQAQGKKYVGSSSSMTSALGHFHFLLSQWRPIDASTLSQSFPDRLRSFTVLQRKPSAVLLRWRDGCYAIDADKEFDSANILSMLGKSMEKLLTLPTDDYERYRKSSEGEVTEQERNAPEAFHYSTTGDFLMRSQLDARDPRLPGTGMFDVKTRAVVSIRMDTRNYWEGTGYQIKNRHGQWESFEREYFDMIRAAFLKYSLQVRMGRMDGIFVAFHNTERIFGFQYISLPEMDSTIHASSDTTLGDQEFKISLDLLNKVLNRATEKYPEQSIRLHFETRETKTPFMYIFAEPVTEEQADEIQSSNKAKVEEFERSILGLRAQDADSETTAEHSKSEEGWEDIRAKIEDELTNDELSPEQAVESSEGEDGSLVDDRDGTQGADDAVEGSETVVTEAAAETIFAQSDENADSATEDANNVEEDLEEPSNDELTNETRAALGEGAIEPETSEIEATDAEEADQDPPMEQHAVSDDGADGSEEDSEADGDHEWLDEVDQEQKLHAEAQGGLLGMTLTIRNKVNGEVVVRPDKLAESDEWSVEYSLDEIKPASRVRSLYAACQARRRKAFEETETEEAEVSSNFYLKNLREMSRKGRIWRDAQDAAEAGREAVLISDGPTPASKEPPAPFSTDSTDV